MYGENDELIIHEITVSVINRQTITHYRLQHPGLARIITAARVMQMLHPMSLIQLYLRLQRLGQAGDEGWCVVHLSADG